MRKYNRIFLIVLDSLGIGAMADSEKFGGMSVSIPSATSGRVREALKSRTCAVSAWEISAV